MAVWSTIITNFQTFMAGLSGITNNTFTESADVVEIDSLPSSIFNGKYSIQFQEIRELFGDVNIYIDENYVVRLQLAFELNQNDNKTKYNNAITDLQTIINHRLKASTWNTTTEIGNIQIQLVGNPRFLYKTNEQFMIVNIDFVVTIRDTLQ